jgi:5-methyltetrahydropteroyltriglutamate--homocysteine methyltransferase
MTLAPDGVVIPFADGHVRQLPRLTGGPFRYQISASTYLEDARKHARMPVKQAVISASALSLLYPQRGIDGYPRAAFLDDLMREAEQDIRRCLQRGADSVQIDFTEGRLAVKLGPAPPERPRGPQQPRPRALLHPGPGADRGAYVPGR